MVHGIGTGKSGLMIIGEAPGMAEDKKGIPFVGRSGKLLRKLIVASGFDVEDVYMTNSVKCRPLNNRTPTQDELQLCKPLLRQEFNQLADDIFIVVTLGNTALNSILKGTYRISQVRGKHYNLGKFVLFPMFHPSYVLRDASVKPTFIKDWITLAEYYQTLRTYHTHTLNTIKI